MDIKCDRARDQDTSESDTIIMQLIEVIRIQATYKEYTAGITELHQISGHKYTHS